METLAWSFTLITVALLLDPTFADVLVQPGYAQQSLASSKSQAINGEQKNQQMTGQSQSQQNYAGAQQNLLLQLLQHQHMLQQQHLNNIHQYEQKQLVQMQRQQLQHPMVQRQKATNNDQIVGMMPFGLSPIPGLISGLGDIATGRLFSMGPMGLNSFTMGGLRPPLLMSPQQTQQMVGSTQFQKSSNGLQDQTRTKREVRDGAGESGSKRYRQPKNSRQQLDGVAANSPVKLKPDTTVVPPQQNPQSPSKSNDDHVVGDSRKINDDTVGGPLDDLIETLRSSGLANPLMELLNGGGYIPQSNFLGKSSSGIPQFEEHVVGQSHQQQQQSDQNPLMSMLGRHQNPPYTSYGYRHPHHMPPPYGIRPTKYYPYRNTALGSPSSPMNEGGSTQFQGDQGQGFWTGSSRQIQPVTGTGNVPQAGAPESPKSISKAPNPAAKFVSDPVIRYSVSHKKNEDPVVVSPNPNTSKATQPAETSKPIASESPMNPTPIQSQTLLPVHGATGKPPVIGAQYPFNMVPHNMVQMMAPYNSMMRSMSPLVGAVNPTDQLSGLLYTLANQLSALGRGGDQYGMNDRFQNYREANFGLGDLLDRGYGSYPGQGSYGTISGIGYNESPYSTTSGYGDPSFPYNQQPFIF
ncbi:uncharacterized protein LOC124296944 isoform X1 [Neodiprion virginianus]|uniref:uncharacterized protein LOC124296944 isoform X1 n=1 Tax=Neodiprion virginianus TaxID=2961670 RepID=UPI001EE6B2FE|nr:uncharacterized protein LOC124296944 isoform X1 [Neodiprion virginianus]